MFLKQRTNGSTASCSAQLSRLKKELRAADAIVIGAGAGLSTAAGYAYTGERFNEYFADFQQKYGFNDMYSGGFYPYSTPEERWAFWSRYIWINRYASAPLPTYERLLALVSGRDCFVLTTNVDHCFQKAGFDKRRLFYTQGDYGLLQCSTPCHNATYDNLETVRAMVLAQGFRIDSNGALLPPTAAPPKMLIPTELIPRCPVCGKEMSMNLRADASFVQDSGWEAAAERYQAFLERVARSRVLFLELGVGYNTPSIIKYPFMRMSARLPRALYCCLNDAPAELPEALAGKAICLQGDIGETLERLLDAR